MDTNASLSLLDVVLTLATPILGWLSLKISKWVGASEANAKTHGMLARVNDSVFTAVKAVNQTARKKLKAAKDPDSDGGTRITDDEAAELKQACRDELQAYWGAKGIAEIGKVLGLGSVTKFLDSKIEAAVSDLKANADPK